MEQNSNRCSFNQENTEYMAYTEKLSMAQNTNIRSLETLKFQPCVLIPTQKPHFKCV